MKTETTLFKLDDAKLARKAELETIISDGIQKFREVGEALAEVRAAKLYADEFETFEEYVKEKWQIGQARAYQLMSAAAVAAKVLPLVEIPTERVARELSKIPVISQKAVAKRLAKEAKPITASRTREVVRQVTARGGLAAMVAAVKDEPQPEIDLNLKPKMTPVAKAQAAATVQEWYAANARRLNDHPAASPETVVRRIVALFSCLALCLLCGCHQQKEEELRKIREVESVYREVEKIAEQAEPRIKVSYDTGFADGVRAVSSNRVYWVVVEPIGEHPGAYGFSEHAAMNPVRMPFGSNGQGYVTLMISTNWTFDWEAWKKR